MKIITKKRIVTAATILFIVSCTQVSEGLRQNDLQSLIQTFLFRHAVYKNLNNTLSERIISNYIYLMDYGKYYFYKSDVDEMMKNKDLVDDYIVQNQFSFVYNMHTLFEKRFKESMKIVDGLIDHNYDFSKEDTITVDRDSVPFAKNRKEMEERWRKNIKLQLLNYLSMGNTIQQARKKLRKKYELTKKRMNETDDEAILAKFMNAFSTSLDPHSNYLTYDEHVDFKISMELKLEGIGVRLKSEDGFVIVESIIPGGAASKLPESLRLKPNDKIVAVAQGPGEPEDVIDMDLQDVVKKIRGQKGSEVRLTVLRKTAESDRAARFVVPIVREEIKLQDSAAKSEYIKFNEGGKEVRLGYIKLPSFYIDPATGKSSATDTRRLLEDLKRKGIDAVVVDLRNNPGGSLNEAIQIAGLFIDSGPILQVKGGDSHPDVMSDSDPYIAWEGPVVVLINRFSASASEILAGAIRDYRRGIIIGPSKTFGKGTVQSYHELAARKGAIKITTHIFYQPSGTSNQINGISPDILVPDLSSIWDIGEDKTRYPLQWKQIARASFTPYGCVSDYMVSVLKNSSSSRIRVNAKYQELIAKIQKYRTQVQNKTISLKEETDLEKQRTKEIERSYSRESDENNGVDLEKDLFLKEAFSIAGDYVRLNVPKAAR
ncbi:MAG: carboxy terminal-processing peptidase [Spirochaetes bacterium]|nr:carboxy terminal-processing peptidase [Spirochaetota bacterium]